MILVRRATNVRELTELLNRIEADDREPLVIVDRPADGTREPQYTVIWKQFKINPEPPSLSPGVVP